MGVLPFCRDAIGIFYCPSRLALLLRLLSDKFLQENILAPPYICLVGPLHFVYKVDLLLPKYTKLIFGFIEERLNLSVEHWDSKKLNTIWLDRREVWSHSWTEISADTLKDFAVFDYEREAESLSCTEISSAKAIYYTISLLNGNV